MNSSQRKQAIEQMGGKLLQELAELRDVTTHLSLLLHDLKFEMDGQPRQLAAALAADCIARSQSRGH